MKKLFLFVSVLFISYSISAQDRVFRLYYLDHERSTDKSVFCKHLEENFDADAADKNVDSFFYLANADAPIIVSGKEESRSEFVNLCDAIRLRKYHMIFPEDDIARIVKLFNDNDYLTEDGAKKYDMLEVRFYIGEDFWLNGYPETLISRLAFIMDWQNLDPSFLHLDVYLSPDDYNKPVFNDERPEMFGSKRYIEPVEFFFQYMN